MSQLGFCYCGWARVGEAQTFEGWSCLFQTLLHFEYSLSMAVCNYLGVFTEGGRSMGLTIK